MKKHYIIISIIFTLFLSACSAQDQIQNKPSINKTPKNIEKESKSDTLNEINKKEIPLVENKETAAISIDKSNYKKSNKYIYFRDAKIENADLDTFEVITSGIYNIAKDKNHVFWFSDIINNADPKTINYIGYGFSKDKNNVYNGTKNLTNINVNTVKFIGLECGDERDVYIIDKNNVYKRDYSDEKGIEYDILKDADPNTFEYIPWENTITSGSNCRYTKDKNNVYDNGEIITDANPNNFEPNE